MKVYCYSRKDFVNTLKALDWNDTTLPKNVAVISICCSDAVKNNYSSKHYDGDDDTHYLKSSDNVLNLDFDDINDETRQCDGYVAVNINDEQAEEAIKFIENNVGEDRVFLIHCNAGKSRSQAFVRYIEMIYKDKYSIETRKENPCLFPNTFVYNKLFRHKFNLL